jgi:hypothetical protein
MPARRLKAGAENGKIARFSQKARHHGPPALVGAAALIV